MACFRKKTFLLLVCLIGISAGSFYFSKKKPTFYEEVSLCLSECSFPYINVFIEGFHYPMVVDLGSRLEMTLKSDFLNPLSKRSRGTETWKNFRGSKFVRPNYKISEAKIGSLTFKNIKVTEELSEEEEDCIIWNDSDHKQTFPQTVGSIGRALFKSTNLLFDIGRSKMIVTNDRIELKKNGYDLEKFVRIPWVSNPKGIVLKVKTDLGSLNLLLDTGFTLTMLRKRLYPEYLEENFDHRGLLSFTSKRFSIERNDFGPKNLCFIEITEELQGIDGAIGMDFIKDHVIYIDFINEEVYISDNNNEKQT